MNVVFHKFTKKTMPPIGADIIVWKGWKDSDGGFPVVARRVQYGENDPYIRYRTCGPNWDLLWVDEYRDCLWALIEQPEQVQERLNRKKGA